jgi:aquaporin Z
MRRYLTEFVGTLFFVLSIGLIVASGSPLAPLYIGSALMVVVYMGGPVSGAHYNPAVSVALTLAGKLPRGDLAPYVAAQVLGGLSGALLADLFLDRTFTVAPAATAAIGTAFLVEVVFTCLLALVVLNCATRASVGGNSYYGLAIGFAIVVGAAAGGPISGGAYNPAVASGAILSDALAGGGGLGQLWLYWLAPVTGGVLGAVLFRLQGEP